MCCPLITFYLTLDAITVITVFSCYNLFSANTRHNEEKILQFPILSTESVMFGKDNMKFPCSHFV